MKVSTKLFYGLLLALSTFLLVGCFGPTPIDTEISAPTNVVITDGVVSWTAVSEATGYTVVVGTTSYSVTTASFDLKTLTLDYGTYMVHVITVKGDKVSLPSSTVEYVLQVTSLAAPTGVTLTDGVVTWNAVPNAASYVVKVGTTTHPVTERTFNLSSLNLAVGTYSVRVVAVSGTVQSPESTAVSFVKAEPEPTELAQPTNVVLTGDVLTWNVVPNATSYVVQVGTTNYTVTTTTFSLATLTLAAGNYNVTVKAVRGSLESAVSVTQVYTIISLSAPTNVVITNGVVTWGAVTNATSYVVRVGATNYPVATTTFDLATLGLAPGEYNITVKAIKDSVESTTSAPQVFIVEAPVVDPDDIIAILLEMMDPDYVPDMTEDDFEWEYEYQEYIGILAVVTAYSTAALEVQMTPENIVAMFDHLMGMPERMENITSPSDMKAEIDSYSVFGLTSQNVSYVVMEVGMAAMVLALDQMEINYLEELAYLENYEEMILSAQDEIDYQTAYQKLAFYAGAENLALLDEFLTSYSDYSFYNEFYALRTMAQEIVWEYQDPWYWEYATEYTFMFYEIILAAVEAEDDVFLGNIANDWDYLWPLQSLLEEIHNMQWRISYLEEMEYQIELLTTMHETMIENRQIFMDSMVTVLNYMEDVYTTMPLTLFVLLDQMVEEGFFTIEEYFLLKNEIVSVLLQTVPSADDFAKVYLSLMVAGSAIQEIDLVKATENAALIGEASNITARLGLAFLAYVDIETVQEIMMKFMEISQAEEPDFVGGIELLVYIGTYVEGFLETEQALVDELEALEMEEFVEELMIFIANVIKQQMANRMDEEEFALIEQLIDEAILDLDVYREGLSILMGFGTELVNEFLASEGYLFIELFTLVQAGIDFDSEEAVIEFALALETLFDDFSKYNTAFFAGMDLATIEKVLRMARVPLLFALVMEEGAELTEANLLFEELVVPVATVLHGMIQIELAVVHALETLGIITEATELEGIDFPIMIMIGVVLLADGVLTVDIEELLYDTMDVVVEDILKHPVILYMLDIDEEALDGMVAYIYDMVADTIFNVREVAEFDFENMTQEEFEQLIGIFEFLMNEEEIEEPIS
jgi:hypothetical protein